MKQDSELSRSLQSLLQMNLPWKLPLIGQSTIILRDQSYFHPLSEKIALFLSAMSGNLSAYECTIVYGCGQLPSNWLPQCTAGVYLIHDFLICPILII